MDHVGTDLSLADAPGSFAQELPFEEAVNFLKGRVPVTKKEWKALEPKLRFRAFTIAKLAQYEAIERVRQGLISALETGDGLAAFWDKLEAKEAASPYYWETVYRTNIQTNYNAGRRIQIDKTKPEALRLIVIEDSRTTKNICLPLVGLTLPADHPFWKTHWPPFHFNCRTTVRPIYKGSAELQGVSASLNAHQNIFKAQSGFGADPLDSGNYWMMLPEMFSRGLVTGAITQFNFMDNVISDFDKVWKGYRRESKTASGWVDVQGEAKAFPEFGENFAVAQRLAEVGMKVKVLPQHYRQGWKNPDYLIDGKLWELETPTAMTEQAVSRAVREGKRQADNLVIHITGEMEDRVLRHAIWLRLIRKDSPASIKELIIFKGGKIEKYSAQFIKANWK